MVEKHEEVVLLRIPVTLKQAKKNTLMGQSPETKGGEEGPQELLKVKKTYSQLKKRPSKKDSHFSVFSNIFFRYRCCFEGV